MKYCQNCDNLKDEVDRLQHRYDHLEAYYQRTDAALSSLMQDVVNFISNATSKSNIPPSSIFGGRLLAALGKATALLHGTTSE